MLMILYADCNDDIYNNNYIILDQAYFNCHPPLGDAAKLQLQFSFHSFSALLFSVFSECNCMLKVDAFIFTRRSTKEGKDSMFYSTLVLCLISVFDHYFDINVFLVQPCALV